MKLGIGSQIPSLSNLPGISRPGGGGGIIPTDPYPYKVSWNVSIGVPKEARIFRLHKSTGDLTIDWGDGTVDILSGTGGSCAAWDLNQLIGWCESSKGVIVHHPVN